MNATTARELRRLARSLGWSKAQYRAAKKKLQGTPRDRRGEALAEMRRWNSGAHPARQRFEEEIERRRATAER